MADLSAEQVKQILANRPPETSPEEIIQGLMDQGHNLLHPAPMTPAQAGLEVPKKALGAALFPLRAAMRPRQALGELQAGQEFIGESLKQTAEQAVRHPLGPGVGGLIGVPALAGQIALAPEGPLETAASLATGLAPGPGKLIKAAKNPKLLRFASQSLSATTGLREVEISKALRNLSEFADARPLEAVIKEYVEKIPGLKGVADSIFERTGSIPTSISDYAAARDYSSRFLKNKEFTDNPIMFNEVKQQALNLVQATNKVLGSKEFLNNKAALRLLLKEKDDAIKLLDQVLPGFQAKNRELGFSFLSEAFNSLAPLNKNKSVSVLRSLLAGRNIGVGLTKLAAGDIIGASANLGAAAISSPRLVKAGLKTIEFLGKERKFPSLSGLFRKAKKPISKELIVK